jgi:amino acid adenylation domain-containing protein
MVSQPDSKAEQPDFSTLVDILRWRTHHQPGKLAYTFLEDGEIEGSTLTYSELDQQARAIGAQLQSLNAAGERALLLYMPGLDFVAAFFGCLYAGVIAVPVYPPNPARLPQTLPKLRSIIGNAQPSVALTVSPILDLVNALLAQDPDFQNMHWLATDVIPDDQALKWQSSASSGESLAFLQYTSGSTGSPKGVMVSHSNLLHNLESIKQSFELTSDSVSVTWLPSFHDMGLIDGVLGPLYTDYLGVLMPPAAFLQRPARWLQAITRYGATHCGGPNFGFKLCVRKVTPEQKQNLDLGTWLTAYNGAEPVRRETLEQFTQAFAPCGFRARFFYPCYGMAEGTLMITGGLAQEEPIYCTVQADALKQNQIVQATEESKDVKHIVGCGRTWLDMKAIIVDPETRIPCTSNRVGEIWVSGSSVAQGYWNRPQETKQTFDAHLADSGEGPFLRTGDLGFLKDGELFITGRIKDLIIIRGRNYYPQDIELTVEQCHPAIRAGCGAAFSTDVASEERLVIAQEVKQEYMDDLDVDQIIDAMRHAVWDEHELQVHAVSLLAIRSIPKTSSGKIQRHACRAAFLAEELEVVGQWQRSISDDALFDLPDADEKRQPVPDSPTALAIQTWLVDKLARRLQVNPEEIDIQKPFAHYGLDSAAAVGLSGELEEWLGRKLSPTLAYDHPTIEAVTRYLTKETETDEALAIGHAGAVRDLRPTKEPIAIIGMGCRFPGGADTPQAYWRLLRDGVDAITPIPDERWDVEAYYDADPDAPGKMYTRYGGFLDAVDQFDPLFFGISPREAQELDPQQRLLLEVGWEALENAGQDPTQLRGSQTGTFIGLSTVDYAQSSVYSGNPAQIDTYTGLGVLQSIAAGRLAYVLGAHGPAIQVDTACSSSLMATHLACQSLRLGECDLALSGGVNLMLQPEIFIGLSRLKALAPDGRCKAFDAAADGYVRAEGCGMVVLKRLSDALEDGDRILAVIRGSAANHDGQSNGLTAPSRAAQEAVIRAALRDAGLTPAQIQYVEAHGTGTALGDPIEALGLDAVYGAGHSAENPLCIGSVKTNMGHLESAAGVAGLIKTVLSLRHVEIPPHLHFKDPSPHIPWQRLSSVVPTALTPWPKSEGGRRAGISSFGMSGTNVHMILEAAPAQVPERKSPVERPLHVLTLSAQTQGALQQLADQYANHIATHPDQDLGDICFTANTGRAHLNQRLAISAASGAQLQERLTALKGAGVVSGRALPAKALKVAFLSPGHGSQYVNMGRELYETQPVFRRALDRCAQVLHSYLDTPLLNILYPDLDDEPPPNLQHRHSRPGAAQMSPIHETAYTQPALFALEYALAELWQSWGIQPDVVMGHSVGEYAAACMAGVFGPEDGLKLIAMRGRLVQDLPLDGLMAMVQASEERVSGVIQPYQQEVSIAAVNGPHTVVISGRRGPVQEVLGLLEVKGIKTRKLKISHAFHSPLMEPMLDDFAQAAAQIAYSPPHIALISNVTGRLAGDEVTRPDYWVNHVRQPVRFFSGMQTLYEQGCDAFIETGPQPTMLGMGRRFLDDQSKIAWLPSLRQGGSDWEQMLHSLSVLYVRGARVDWAALEQGYARRKVTLPTYPFQRKRYWIEKEPASGQLQRARPQTLGLRQPEPKRGDTYMDREQWSPDVPRPGIGFSKNGRRDKVLLALRSLMADLLRASPSEIDVHIPLLEMGTNSLILMEALRAIQSTFGVEISLPQLFEQLNTLAALATYLDQNMPEEMFSEEPVRDEQEPAGPPQPAIGVSPLLGDVAQAALAQALPGGKGGEQTGLEQILAQQLQTIQTVSQTLSQTLSQVVSQQLEFLQSQGALAETKAPRPLPARQRPQAPTPSQAPSAIAASLPSHKVGTTGKSPEHKRHLEELTARHTQRTQTSKQLMQDHRHVLAENRAVAGFRLSTKEMLYLLSGARSQGARVWDVDDNEYIDIAMGFGVHLFGHNPPFVTQAIKGHIDQGMQLALHVKLAGEVAQLVSELTGMERVAFCTTGTEAVMTAMRLARAKTRRSKIVIFSGSYHGHSDGVLGVRPARSDPSKVIPVVPGVTQNMVNDLLILDYGDPQSLDVIQDHAHELAAVLVEPVQSRRPDLQPREFLHQLREITRQAEIALIFDEMITGFRILPGGAQAWFDVEADLATYGKVVGGGLPIAAVAGKAAYMDCLDGGTWNYGDASYPQTETTFFAGTFSTYPLAMATAQAVLQHIKQQGPAMYQQLNARSHRLAETLNTYFERDQVPIRITHFGSLFHFVLGGDLDLLFYHLLEKGVYTWEGRTCFLSTAHTDKDVDDIIQAVKESVDELRADGFLNGRKTSEQKVSSPSHTFPLSEAQKQLWVLTKLDIEGWLAYNIHTTFQLRGPLHLTAMRKAVQQVVERHETLRTTISEDGDFQRVLPSLEVEVPLIDFSNWRDQERETRISAWFRAKSQQPFDLAQGALLRVHILKLEDELHVLAITSHHILVDGWSMNVILQDLAAFYAVECQESVCQLEPAVQFRDYLRRQELQSQTEEMAVHRAYWLEGLDSIPVLDLPADRPRPPMKTFRGARQTTRVDADLYHKLQRVSQEQGCTLFMTLFAAYTTLLHRLSGQNEILVGIPVLGRSTEGNKPLVGYCTHLLPIRSTLVGNPTFSEHLVATRKALLYAYQHQDYPFAALLNDLNVRGDASQSPVITATFNMDQPMAMPEMADLQLELYARPLSFTQFDLTLNITELPHELVAECDYNTDLFDAATITRLMGHLKVLLEGIVNTTYPTTAGDEKGEPEPKITDLPLLTGAEWRQLLVEWNDTQAEYSRGKCMHHLFETQVERTPDAVAVVFPSINLSASAGQDGDQTYDVAQDRRLTYRELNARANQLAHYLQGLGIKSETLVGIYMERSLEMMVALLGTLKAGGAYVPLDPTYPRERLTFMLQDSQALVLLTQEKLKPDIPPVHNIHSQRDQQTGTNHTPIVVCLDTDWDTIVQESKDNPSSQAKSENLAYVIYTSGSTGKPKGVQIPHYALTNFLESMRQCPGLAEQDVLLSVTTLSFDIVGLEFFLPLIVGSRVVIASREIASDGGQLVACLNECRVTVMQATPATWQILLEAGWQGDQRLGALCGGEALPRQLANRLLKRVGCLWNMYGPTETTIWSTVYQVEEGSGPVSIGRPIANTQIYILDQRFQPVPVGVLGDLYIGGDGLARGYLNRPALTAEKFIPDPFNSKAGSRLYNTGDMARFLPDGNVEFLGRKDFQVKLRGFRIELGEIEAMLAQHPAVQQAVVIVWEDQPGDSGAFLVAYIVGETAHSKLREYLKQKLPDYMVPSVFVRLEELPLTPNNKVNRQALPAPERTGLEQDYVAPRTPTEEILAEIWAQVLRLERVGIHDNFFALGGHSLLATQVISRLRETLQVELPVRSLFEAPTTAEMVVRIEKIHSRARDLRTPPKIATSEYEEGEI